MIQLNAFTVKFWCLGFGGGGVWFEFFFQALMLFCIISKAILV